MLTRKQIQFTKRQLQAIRKEAARRGVSDAEVVRTAVEASLVEKPKRVDDAGWERMMSLVGTGHSGLGDLSVNHDEYYAKDLEDEIREGHRAL